MTMIDEKATKIHGLDLAVITTDLTAGGMQRGEAEQAVRYYREFLCTIAAYPDATLVPCRLIDKAWHAHMCRPVKYVRDCMAVFGTVIDHTPGVYGTKEWLTAYELTRKLAPYGADMPVDATTSSPMAGAECFREAVQSMAA